MNEHDATEVAYKNGYKDAIREMQKMLCEGRVSNDPVVIVTNVVAKEMLEET